MKRLGARRAGAVGATANATKDKTAWYSEWVLAAGNPEKGRKDRRNR